MWTVQLLKSESQTKLSAVEFKRPFHFPLSKILRCNIGCTPYAILIFKAKIRMSSKEYKCTSMLDKYPKPCWACENQIILSISPFCHRKLTYWLNVTRLKVKIEWPEWLNENSDALELAIDMVININMQYTVIQHFSLLVSLFIFTWVYRFDFIWVRNRDFVIERVLVKKAEILKQ